MKYDAKKYLQIGGIVVLVLALVRCVFPSIAENKHQRSETTTTQVTDSLSEKTDSVASRNEEKPTAVFSLFKDNKVSHRVKGVLDYKKAFPDDNDVQLKAANTFGVSPIEKRDEARNLTRGLFFIAGNPFYTIDNLQSSIPYLVPRAAVLLQDIGKSFMDSLFVKGLPLHKIVITSVTRTKEDVIRLRTHNRNATENSCHMYGTTFDISYKRFKTIQGEKKQEKIKGTRHYSVKGDTLKMVLSEVLNDMRQGNRCFVKYELHQGCFHVTTR